MHAFPKPSRMAGSSKTNSSYRKRLADLMQMVDPSLSGERGGKVLEFLDLEWRCRNLDFIKKFSVCAKQTDKPSDSQLSDLVKFGGKRVGVQVIANNLSITYADALFRVLTLVSLGLVRRTGTGPGYGAAKPGKLVALFSSESEIKFCLKVLLTEKFSAEDVPHLVRFFRPEIEADLGEAAIRMVRKAADAGTIHENTSGDCSLPTQRIVYLTDKRSFSSIASIAKVLGISEDLTMFSVLVLACSGHPVERIDPYCQSATSTVLIRHNSTGYGYAGSDPAYDDLDPAADIVEMGELPIAEHRAIIEGDLGKMPKDLTKAVFENAQSESPTAATIEGPNYDLANEDDELAMSFNALEDGGVPMEPTRQEMVDSMDMLEERIYAAEDLASKVSSLEKDFTEFRDAVAVKVDAIMQKLGISAEQRTGDDTALADLQVKYDQIRGELSTVQGRLDTANSHNKKLADMWLAGARGASMMVEEMAADFMPTSKNNNDSTRKKAAMDIAAALRQRTPGLPFMPFAKKE